ncbi:unnamed protein product [Ectocarpus sp. 13 AM-2016]
MLVDLMSAVAYLVLANPSSKNNLGTLIRCGAAFAVEEVIVVGAFKWSTHGAHGSHKHLRYRCFHDWETAATFLRDEKGCDLCGVVNQSQIQPQRRDSPVVREPPPPVPPRGSVVPGSAPESTTSATNFAAQGESEPGVDSSSASLPLAKIAAAEQGAGSAASELSEEGILWSSSFLSPPPSSQEEERVPEERLRGASNKKDRPIVQASTAMRRRPFRRSTAFLVGHGNRLDHEALDVCDFFVHVEMASESPMELAAPVTTSIALHHFTAWANYEEQHFTGEKFNVDVEAARRHPPIRKDKNPLAEERVRLRKERVAADPLEAAASLGDEGAQGGGGLGWLTGVEGDATANGDY